MEKTFAGAPFFLPLRQTKNIPVRCPIEAKGIAGADGRKYILDLPRLTPRDANWVPTEEGGTDLVASYAAPTSHTTQPATNIPASLDDDEWTALVLRPELLEQLKEKKVRRPTPPQPSASPCVGRVRAFRPPPSPH
jgi:hypothetical protein